MNYHNKPMGECHGDEHLLPEIPESQHERLISDHIDQAAEMYRKQYYAQDDATLVFDYLGEISIEDQIAVADFVYGEHNDAQKVIGALLQARVKVEADIRKYAAKLAGVE